MSGLLAISILVVPLLFARYAAELRSARRGLRLTVVLALTFSAAWVFSLYFLYFKLA
jgi:hypothetical protein